MGLIRKTLFIGSTVATGGVPLVRWNSSAEKAAKKSLELQREQNRLLAEQNRLLAASHGSGAVTSRPTQADRASRKESVGPRKDWQPGTRAWQGRPHGRFLSLWMYRSTKSEGNGRSAYGNQIYERLMPHHDTSGIQLKS